MKKALITGISGQDGSYLTELLLEKGYVVHGLKRRSSSFNTARIDHLYQDPHDPNPQLKLHYGDMTDSTCLIHLIQQIKPDEIYNLAAQSHVHVSFEMPEYTANADAIGTLRLLEAIRISGREQQTRFYQASTSEMYGGIGATMPATGYTEESAFYPKSPYGAAKLYAHRITKNYRESYGMFAVSGILFNHESPRRGETFVTRKITRAIAQIHLGLQDCLYLGNIEAKRDRGHAKDYVEGMRRMVQAPTPDDFVLATGATHSVRSFVERACAYVGIHLERTGSGTEEVGKDKKSGQVIIRIDPRYYRPCEVDVLLGDATKAKRLLGRTPTYTLSTLVEEMMQADIDVFKKQKLLQENGFTVLSPQE